MPRNATEAATQDGSHQVQEEKIRAALNFWGSEMVWNAQNPLQMTEGSCTKCQALQMTTPSGHGSLKPEEILGVQSPVLI